MKSQDLLFTFKILCLSHKHPTDFLPAPQDTDWQGWDDIPELLHIEALNQAEEALNAQFTVRGLSASLGMSKSEVSNSFKRCVDAGLVRKSHLSGKYSINKEGLFNFVQYALKMVFPVKPAALARGIPTTFAAPVLKGKLLSGDDIIMVWPDAHGKEMGQAIEPLYKSVPLAVRQDAELYACMALLDAIRIGHAREVKFALDKLKGIIFDGNI